MKILPSINVQSVDEALEHIGMLRDYAKEFHLDVSSPEFNHHRSWDTPSELNLIPHDIRFHIHLMLSLKPQEVLQWNNDRTASIAIHLEGSSLPDGLLRIAKRTKKNIYLAWSPEIELSFLEKYIPHAHGVLVLGVVPGKSGQGILPDTFKRVHAIKEKLSSAQKLIIDGGINEKNIQEAVGCEPDYIVVGSAIYKSDNPITAYKNFQEYES